jgi:hypothetical protein
MRRNYSNGGNYFTFAGHIARNADTVVTTDRSERRNKQRRRSIPVLLRRLDDIEWHGGSERMFTVELYAGARRAVMVDVVSRR